GDQYETAMIKKDVLGMDWAQDATVLSHVTGAAAAPLSTITGGSQTGSTLTVSAVGAGGMKKGDIITIAGVYSVNRVTKVSTGQLAQFVLTADANAGATTLAIYPALIPAAAGPTMAPYQTVTASPLGGAQIVGLTNAGE